MRPFLLEKGKSRTESIDNVKFTRAKRRLLAINMQAMQTNGQDNINGIRFVNESGTMLSGAMASGQEYIPLTALKPESLKRTAIDAGIDEESDSDSGNSYQQPREMKAGKKTKGRVKIKMEFIENKLRRYTTFSKRKTGIMKKVSLQPFYSF